MEVNYRWKKHYKTAKYPIRQPAWLTWESAGMGFP